MTAEAGSSVVEGAGSGSPDSPDGGRIGVAVAVPGLTGGVDEAARHLFGDEAMTGRWEPHVLITRGGRSWAAPLVLGRAVVVLVVWRLTGRVRLVHLNMSSKGSAARKMALAAVARSVGLPYVIQLHGGGFAAFYDGLPGLAKRPVRAIFAGARHVFVLGQPFQELVEGTIGIDGSRVSILRNAVPMPARSDRSSDGSGDGTVDGSDQTLILFTGRLGAGKGVPELVDALARVAERPWRAVLAGDGDVEGTSAHVAAVGLADRVEVRGWQSREAVSNLLDKAEVFVLPSHLEALSVSLLEAMAAGLCCVATAVGAHGEVVDDGTNGLLVTPGDVDGLASAFDRALGDADLRRRLGAQARRTVEEQCSTDVVAAQLSAVYEEILNRS